MWVFVFLVKYIWSKSQTKRLCTGYLKRTKVYWLDGKHTKTLAFTGIKTLYYSVFYFTCNESKIYESFTFLNKLQEKIYFFTIHTNVQVHFLDVSVHISINKNTLMTGFVVQGHIRLLLH